MAGLLFRGDAPACSEDGSVSAAHGFGSDGEWRRSSALDRGRMEEPPERSGEAALLATIEGQREAGKGCPLRMLVSMTAWI